MSTTQQQQAYDISTYTSTMDIDSNNNHNQNNNNTNCNQMNEDFSNTNLRNFMSTCKILSNCTPMHGIDMDYGNSNGSTNTAYITDYTTKTTPHTQQQTVFANNAQQQQQQQYCDTSSSTCSENGYNCTLLAASPDSPMTSQNQKSHHQMKHNTQGTTATLTCKKGNNKKKAQVTSEVDEERTSQLVLELLKNIKEKTKELESMNQNVKSTKSVQQQQQHQQQHYYANTNVPSPGMMTATSPNVHQASNVYPTAITTTSATTPSTSTIPSSSSPSSSSSSTSSSSSSTPTPLVVQQINSNKKIKRINSTTPKKSITITKINSNILQQTTNTNGTPPITTINTATTNMANTHSYENEKLSQNYIVTEATAYIHVPVNWKRTVDENGYVVYTSPTGVSLKSKDEIYTYLTSANTCKCGLQCPLDVNKTFNFDPKIESKHNGGGVNGNGMIGSCCVHKTKSSDLNESGKIVKKKKSDKKPNKDVDGQQQQQQPKKKGRKPKQIKFNEMNMNGSTVVQVQYNNNSTPSVQHVQQAPSQSPITTNTHLYDMKPLNFLNHQQTTITNYLNPNTHMLNTTATPSSALLLQNHDRKPDTPMSSVHQSQQQQQQTQKIILQQNFTDLNENFGIKTEKTMNDSYITLTTLTNGNNGSNGNCSRLTTVQQQQASTTNDFYLINDLINSERGDMSASLPSSAMTSSSFKNFKIIQNNYYLNNGLGNCGSVSSGGNGTTSMGNCNSMQTESINMNKCFNKMQINNKSNVTGSSNTAIDVNCYDVLNENKLSMNMIVNNKKEDDDDNLLLSKHKSSVINEITGYDQLMSAHISFPQDLSELCKLVSDSSAIYNDSHDLVMPCIDSEEDFKIDVKYV